MEDKNMRERLKEVHDFAVAIQPVSKNPFDAFLKLAEIMNLSWLLPNEPNDPLKVLEMMQSQIKVHKNADILIELIQANSDKFDLKDTPLTLILLTALSGVMRYVMDNADSKSEKVDNILKQVDLSNDTLEKLRKFYYNK